MNKKLVELLIGLLLLTTPILIQGSENNSTDIQHSTPIRDVDWWPQYLHDSGHTGYSTSDTPETNNTIWINEFDAIDNAYHPVIVDGKLYVGIGDDTDLNKHSLYCFDSLTGEVLWVNNTGMQFRSTPVVANDKVYLILGVNLVCYNAETGDFLWDEYIGSPYGFSLTYDNERFFIGISYSSIGSHYMGCYNSENGSVIWTFYPDDRIKTIPAVVDNKVFFCSKNTLYCLDAEGNGDGTTFEYWNIPIGDLGIGAPAPCVSNEKIFLGNTTGFYCFNTSNGSIIWEHSLMSTATSPLYAYGKIFISSFADHNLYCLDAEGNGDGTTFEYWNISNIWFFSSIADGKLFTGGYNKQTLYCFDTENGQQIWNYSINGSLMYSCLANKMVFFVTYHTYFDSTRIYCFRDNSPPDIPDIPDGPTECIIDEVYTYTTSEVIDPDGDAIDQYGWDINGDFELDYLTSEPTLLNSWDEAGTFEVRVMAQDIYGMSSDFSDPLEVEVFAPELEIGDITGGLLSIKTEIINGGTIEINDIDWSISVSGGILGLINKEITGSIATLEPGASELISISPIIGLGPIEIIVTVNAEGMDEIEKTADGFVIFFFVIIT